MSKTILRVPKTRHGGERGFTSLELMIVVAMSLVIAAVAIPGYLSMTNYLHIAGDARDVSGLVAEAKMRAAEDFTHARVRANLGTNTFQLEVWDKTVGCWKTDGDVANRCTVNASPVQPLSTGDTFGTGNTGPGGTNPQAVIAQAPACTTGVAGTNPGGVIDGTACIEFNSRGVPVASTGAPTANDALYVTNTTVVYGTTVIISGMIQQWSAKASTAAWQAR
jgi:Tfp pilus assembly protein FimT